MNTGEEMQTEVSHTKAERIWSDARNVLKTILNSDIYNLWFAPLNVANLEGDTLVIQVANDFYELWLRDNYWSLMGDAIAQAAGQPMRLRLMVEAQQLEARAERLNATELSDFNQRPMSQPESHTISSPEWHGIRHFNPKNTFANFVVGSNNNFAHAAAVAVAQAPGKSYNPLFVYGGVGLGKTHLLHAIGQHVAFHQRSAKVAYVSSEKFTNEYIDAIQNNQLVRFRKKYRQLDVLLIDDIQFLSGKERIQEEFFHTFNALHENHKQVVLSCDRPAGEIQNLEVRLVSRFEWGLITDLQPPDVETRVAILRQKEKAMGVELAPEVISFLAQRIRANIRRLEGALIRVASFASLTGKRVSVEIVEGLLRDVLSEEGQTSISIELIQKKVAEHFDIRLADMTSKRRPENIYFPRQVAMYLSRALTESSLNTIGDAFGGRDHGTVLHACRQVKDRMEAETGVRQAVNLLEDQLRR
jgi:chromosomal replication initiator protein